MVDDPALGELPLEPGALALDVAGCGHRHRADLEHLGPRRHLHRHAVDAVLRHHLEERRRRGATFAAANQILAEPSELTRSGSAAKRDRRNRCLVQTPRKLLSDLRPLPRRHVVYQEFDRGNTEGQLIARVERRKRALRRFDRSHTKRAGRRIGMELLDGTGEQSEDLLDRLPVGRPHVRTHARTFVDRLDKVVIDRRCPGQHRSCPRSVIPCRLSSLRAQR